MAPYGPMFQGDADDCGTGIMPTIMAIDNGHGRSCRRSLTIMAMDDHADDHGQSWPWTIMPTIMADDHGPWTIMPTIMPIMPTIMTIMQTIMGNNYPSG